MRLLKEIIFQEGINLHGRAIFREAVRAIVIQEQKLLMILSAKHGDYKFPGGGVEAGETHLEALAREVKEECGASISGNAQAFGKIIEYDLPIEKDYEIFKMTSFYYLCQIENIFQTPNPEQYEIDLGYQPIWVDVETAIQANRSLLSAGYQRESRWIEREAFVLEQVKQEIF